MKVLFRIILFLLLLVLLCGVAGILSIFTPIPWLSSFVQTSMKAYPWLTLVFSIMLLVFAAAVALALILTVSVPTKKKLFVLGRGMGRIEITRRSIESVASATVETVPDVKRYFVQVKGSLRPRRVKLDVQVEPQDEYVDLAQLGAAVQQRLVQEMAESLAVEPRHVKVRIQPVHHHQRHLDKVPRVV